MAYSNCGAYVWKNGVFMRKLCDKTLSFIDNEWKINDELSDNGNKSVGSHAAIPLGRFCLEFYKTYSPKIHFESAEYKYSQTVMSVVITKTKI